MDHEQVRLLKTEGAINALAKAWLFLAAQAEIRGQLDPELMEQALLKAHWSGAPFEPHAQQLMQHLAEQLADARETRRKEDLYRRTGYEE